MIEHKIGEIITFKDGYLEVINKRLCSECYLINQYYTSEPCCNYYSCLSHERKDKENVIFKFLTLSDVRRRKLNKINERI